MRILLIEDDVIQGETLPIGLRLLGHSCDWSPGAEAALAMMDVHPYEALLVDQSMPGTLDGLGLIRRVRQAGAEVPWKKAVPAVLLTAVSGDALDAAHEALSELAPAALVRKPARLEEIDLALTKMVAHAAAAAGDRLPEERKG